MQSKILAAVDGSECAKKGFQIALDMSLDKQDSPILVVLAVVQPLEVMECARMYGLRLRRL